MCVPAGVLSEMSSAVHHLRRLGHRISDRILYYKLTTMQEPCDPISIKCSVCNKCRLVPTLDRVMLM